MMRALLAALLLIACRAPQAPEGGRAVGGADLVVANAPLTPEVARVKVAAVTFPDGSRLSVPVADTPQTRERGLMFREKLGPDEGMLFIFDSDMTLGFWMKNTFVDLDMLWLDAAGRVTTLHERVPRSKPGMRDDEVASRSGYGRFVLELAAGEAGRRKALRGTTLGLKILSETP